MFAVVSLPVSSHNQRIISSNCWKPGDTNILLQDINTLRIERVNYNKVRNLLLAGERFIGSLRILGDNTIYISQHYDLRVIEHNFNTSLIRHRQGSPWVCIRGMEYRFEFVLGCLRDRVRGTEIARFKDSPTRVPVVEGFLYFHTLGDYIIGHYTTSNSSFHTQSDISNCVTITLVFDAQGVLCDAFADPEQVTILFNGRDRQVQSKMRLLSIDY